MREKWGSGGVQWGKGGGKGVRNPSAGNLDAVFMINTQNIPVYQHVQRLEESGAWLVNSSRCVLVLNMKESQVRSQVNTRGGFN
ncbi:hypothetical protein E2C01_053782 [Portunus trituberculatus]|uniref:Uncharacterized protein n=1 Tax=Portunus trituberculatus TaxID=210409 RepID=A0A5B7GT69_PORTR|nr:hypothetical protein [Portunus trituberculatus]